MPYMKMCVYDLAVGSDMAINETEVAKVRGVASISLTYATP